ncbi:hypothetical protein BDZ91DRAFT_801483 [Kalaharituber pfeilii]|nr:hypothetical protein BDZ91DRAFT_801483 [Kalaharituber pfeilii]
MPRKGAVFSGGPKALFKKRSSLPGSGIGSLRASSWSMGEIFKSNPIEAFTIEELGGKSGHLVYGPVSVFNGSITLTVKSPLPNVTVSVSFRGLTEYNGRMLAFLNVTQTLWSGDLEPGLRNFLFALKFPAVNLPPSSQEPFIEYNFVAQVRPALRTYSDHPSTPPSAELKTYTSKPYCITFVPYVDPFAKSRFERKEEALIRRMPVEFKPPLTPLPPPAPASVPPVRPPGGGRPLLKLTTENLPPSPTMFPVDRKAPQITPSNVGADKSAVILDGNGRVMAKLKVSTTKKKFVPGDEVDVTITLTISKGMAIPKHYSVKIIERRTLGFETDEDAELVDTASDDGQRSRKTTSGKIFNRVLIGRKSSFSRTATPVDNRPTTTGSNMSTFLEGGMEIVETINVRLPTFKTFIDDSLLPSAALPLGPSYKEISPASPVPSPFIGNVTSSLKGKEPIRLASAPRPLTGTTVSSDKLNRSIDGLQYIVAHSLNVTVPLSSGLIRKSSGTLDVDVELILGNKTPDLYGYQSNSVNGSTEVLKVSTPELVIVPPEQNEPTGVGLGLRHQDSKTSFKREPSPLRNVGGYGGRAESSGSGLPTTNGYARSLKAASSRVSFRSLEAVPDVKWKKGERFPTLDESDERPSFLTN